ncbi:hypothetical protein EVG20_g9755 [Dentipellis fragilis]|uniref:Uncharacterized protein n=1 Tax=Dentipellis fragilis TaxID=205917 RepID=A0A4Y9XY58_9AGAM|nr:hypothetical protein EVG20_g9755 [Dentipellis fragilis]
MSARAEPEKKDGLKEPIKHSVSDLPQVVARVQNPPFAAVKVTKLRRRAPYAAVPRTDPVGDSGRSGFRFQGMSQLIQDEAFQDVQGVQGVQDVQALRLSGSHIAAEMITSSRSECEHGAEQAWERSGGQFMRVRVRHGGRSGWVEETATGMDMQACVDDVCHQLLAGVSAFAAHPLCPSACLEPLPYVHHPSLYIPTYNLSLLGSETRWPNGSDCPAVLLSGNEGAVSRLDPLVDAVLPRAVAYGELEGPAYLRAMSLLDECEHAGLQEPGFGYAWLRKSAVQEVHAVVGEHEQCLP